MQELYKGKQEDARNLFPGINYDKLIPHIQNRNQKPSRVQKKARVLQLQSGRDKEPFHQSKLRQNETTYSEQKKTETKLSAYLPCLYFVRAHLFSTLAPKLLWQQLPSLEHKQTNFRLEKLCIEFQSRNMHKSATNCTPKTR